MQAEYNFENVASEGDTIMAWDWIPTSVDDRADFYVIGKVEDVGKTRQGFFRITTIRASQRQYEVGEEVFVPFMTIMDWSGRVSRIDPKQWRF